MPALMIVLARWVPPHERSRQGALVFGGAQIGNIFGSFMSGFLMAGNGDWANVFYFFGCFGILWFIFWVSVYLDNLRLKLKIKTVNNFSSELNKTDLLEVVIGQTIFFFSYKAYEW